MIEQKMKYNIQAVKPEIFRACDIRGVVGKTLTEEVAYLLGLSFGTLALQKNQSQVVVGRDGRHSGAWLSESLSQGLMASGCDVIDLGQVPTPIVYFATYELKTATGIMITGSHNPPDYNGFKMMLAGDTLAEKEVEALYHCIQTEQFASGNGRLIKKDMIGEYITKIQQDVKIKRRLKVAIDCGSGVVGCLAEDFFSSLGCDVVPLYCQVDGDFPYHHPDPGQPENLQDLIKTVVNEQCDLGLAFDGDGDRLGVITNRGEIIWPDRVMMLFAADLLQRVPNSKIIFDVKCSKLLGERIAELGGEPIMYKTGHALIKREMKRTQAALSGEMSGHFFFKERWYGFDDACYAGARLLEIISQQSKPLDQLFSDIPNSVNTPEINIAIAEEKKFAFIDALKERHGFHDSQLITVDGLRAEFKDGWGLVRASNTTPCLVLRFEAENLHALQRIQAEFKRAILQLAPELKVPF